MWQWQRSLLAPFLVGKPWVTGADTASVVLQWVTPRWVDHLV